MECLKHKGTEMREVRGAPKQVLVEAPGDIVGYDCVAGCPRVLLSDEPAPEQTEPAPEPPAIEVTADTADSRSKKGRK